MTRWTDVPITIEHSGDAIAPGDRVPGRITVMEEVRRDGAARGFRIDGPVDDWTGLDEAIVWLEVQDVDVPAGRLAWPQDGRA